MFKFHSLLIPKSEEQIMFRKEIKRVDLKVTIKVIDNFTESIKSMNKAIEQACSSFSIFGNAVAVKKASEFEEDLKKVSKIVEENERGRGAIVEKLIEEVVKKYNERVKNK